MILSIQFYAAPIRFKRVISEHQDWEEITVIKHRSRTHTDSGGLILAKNCFICSMFTMLNSYIWWLKSAWICLCSCHTEDYLNIPIHRCKEFACNTTIFPCYRCVEWSVFAECRGERVLQLKGRGTKGFVSISGGSATAVFAPHWPHAPPVRGHSALPMDVSDLCLRNSNL